MKWYKEDIKKYLPAKEYVDTVIIPLQSFHLSGDAQLEQDTFNREILQIYANEIEKELMGRVMLTPTYYYLKSADLSMELSRLKSWIKDIEHQPMKEIFLFTFDTAWKKIEKELPCQLIWFPGMKTTGVQSEETGKLIHNQVGQISELIRSYW